MGIYDQFLINDGRIDVELNIADDGSTDDLDDLLEQVSGEYEWVVNKYTTSPLDERFFRRFNCPAAKYNFLVAASSEPFILKIDPEFVLITKGFVEDCLIQLNSGAFMPYFLMPYPYHVYDFKYSSLEDIKEKYKDHVYETHISPQTAHYNNVYYACMFRRKAFIQLGGIEMLFLDGIGSEDDHFLDQWRRHYGNYVETLMGHKGIHLWHGEWGKGVPQELYGWVNKNASLRKDLDKILPNKGDFASIKFPLIHKQTWEDGKKLEGKYWRVDI